MGSLIYSNLSLYKLIMYLLYSGPAIKRLEPVLSLIQAGSVTELCFGDTLVAGWCHSVKIRWTGYDISKKFVHCAKKKGFDARLSDLRTASSLESSDVCIMTGSLYHFRGAEKNMVNLMLKTAPRLIISEPVSNITSVSLFGKFARLTGIDREPKRFTKAEFITILDELARKTGCTYQIAAYYKKDIIVEINR